MMRKESKIKFILYSGHDVTRKQIFEIYLIHAATVSF